MIFFYYQLHIVLICRGLKLTLFIYIGEGFLFVGTGSFISEILDEINRWCLDHSALPLAFVGTVIIQDPQDQGHGVALGYHSLVD